jgi:3-phosphoshikimate 1-carboxyvinyltransferase
MLAALADGSCRITNPLRTGDCLATRACLEGLGVRIQTAPAAAGSVLVVEGCGLHGLREPEDVLNVENSGTTARLLSGLLAGRGLHAVLTGDASLRRRPMLRVVAPLRRMGARIEGRAGGQYAPLCFLPGAASLAGGLHVLEIASAQVKSALLLAGLRCVGELRLGGMVHSRDHTERFLRFLGVDLTVDGEEIYMRAPERLPSFEMTVPGDPSSASFLVAGALLSGRPLVVESCGLNPSRLGFLRVLERMGAGITQTEGGSSAGEPVGRLTVGPGTLSGTTVVAAEVPDLIDEIPLLAVVACAAHGVTEVRGAEELRHKESDRIQGIANLIGSLGGTVAVLDDGFRISGPQRLCPGTVDPVGDHRLAMAAAVASALVSGAVTVAGFGAAAVSYPDFVSDFEHLGGLVTGEPGKG